MKKHKAYFQYDLEAIFFSEIETPDGERISGDDERKSEIVQKIFAAHPDLFPVPQNAEKAGKILSVEENIVDNADDGSHITAAKIVNSYFYINRADYFRFEKNAEMGTGEDDLYCDAITINIELELDCSYDDLDEEEQEVLSEAVSFGGIGYDLSIDGYIFCGAAVEHQTRYLGDTPESLGDEAGRRSVEFGSDFASGAAQAEKHETTADHLAAVQKDGAALQFVPNKLKTPEICLAAVQQSEWAFQFVPKKLRTPELCLAAAKKNGTIALDYAPNEHKTPELFLAAVQSSCYALKLVPEQLRTAQLCLIAVQGDGNLLDYVPEDIRTLEICLAALRQYGGSLEYVPEALKTPEFCLDAVRRDSRALEHVPEELKTPEVCLGAVQQYGYLLEFVPEEFKTPELCMAAVKMDPAALDFVPQELVAQVQEMLE